MVFNSFDFVFFFVAVTTLYFALPHRLRWPMLLVASCAFYMAFIPAYILILLATILVDYLAGIWIEDTSDGRKKRRYLMISIISLCSVLFVFKYANFFNQNMAALAKVLDWNYSAGALRIILPIGLSFHTFQSLSYVIEVYRGNQKAERHFGIYALYVMYFPQLVAGPIERPQNLLHQFHEEKQFDWSRICSGLSLMLWGLFKKVVVADSVGLYVDAVYNSNTHHNGTSLLLATYFFAFQIYCDFSGYTDIARGVSRVYGIELMKNFETPYFSTSIAGFWSRWHISLSTWFRDYVYIPLGGNRVPLPRNLFNIFFVFLISGLWHGASWTFVIWGALHGTYLILERLGSLLCGRPHTRNEAKPPNMIWAGIRLFVTFHLVLVAWVFFRADSLSSALGILRKIAFVHGPLFWDPIVAQGCLGIIALLGLELFNRKTDFWDTQHRANWGLRAGYMVALLFGVVLFGVDHGTQFIYFQF